MARISFTETAQPGDVFARTAFDSQIGKVIPVEVEDGRGAGGHVNGKIVGVEVSEDGRAVHMTLEIPEGLMPRAEPKPGSFSIREVGEVKYKPEF